MNVSASNNKVPSPNVNSLSWVQLLQQWLAGVLDALHIFNIFRVVSRSVTVRERLRDVFLFNGIICLGSFTLFQYLILPLLYYLYESNPPKNNFVASLSWLTESMIIFTYYVTWIIPVFLLSFLINPKWLGIISERSYKILKKRNPPSGETNIGHLPKEIAAQVYNLTFCVMFVLQSSFCYFVPFVGSVLNLVFLCWLYSLYCFEWKWNHWHVGRRLKYIEDNWAYFCGFGLVVGTPFTVASTYCGIWISYAVWFLVFPFFIIAAIGAKKPPHRVVSKDTKTHLFLFRSAMWLNTTTLNFAANVIKYLTGGINQSDLEEEEED